MKFIITRASGRGADKSAEIRHGGISWDDEYGVWVIDVNSIDELVELIEHYNHALVVGDTKYDFEFSNGAQDKYPHQIIIYDDYID